MAVAGARRRGAGLRDDRLGGHGLDFDRLFWVDLALAPAIACLLIGLAAGRPAPLLRLLDSRPIRGLGSSSYSLYLTHAPIIAIVYELFVAHWLHPGPPPSSSRSPSCCR